MTTRVTQQDTTISQSRPLPTSHIGYPGNTHGLCGAPTFGLLAINAPTRCRQCNDIWEQMSPYERRFYRGQP